MLSKHTENVLRKEQSEPVKLALHEHVAFAGIHVPCELQLLGQAAARSNLY
jgi:hypothetical protein